MRVPSSCRWVISPGDYLFLGPVASDARLRGGNGLLRGRPGKVPGGQDQKPAAPPAGFIRTIWGSLGTNWRPLAGGEVPLPLVRGSVRSTRSGLVVYGSLGSGCSSDCEKASREQITPLCLHHCNYASAGFLHQPTAQTARDVESPQLTPKLMCKRLETQRGGPRGDSAAVTIG